MHRKMFWKPAIDDVQNKGCSYLEREILLDIFEAQMKKMACTALTKGWYQLLDGFFLAKKNKIKGYSLTMERYPHAGAEQWIGVFEAEGKSMKVFGTLEPDD